MRLFHISEEKGIKAFSPRPIKKEVFPKLKGKYIWAITDEMVHNYYFPRNCPRVCRMIGKDTTESEKENFYKYGRQKGIIFINQEWKDRIYKTILYRYEFDIKNFELIDYEAGYYISTKEEIPIAVIEISNPIRELELEGILINYTEDLEKYRIENAKSKYRFSNIKINS